ncbi:hypothetical protein [Hymenobacter elongatus]|uniref:Uncharacterized protein n=1 Tax=Hymenobacter elongatus TaxID=877208 RepID=A0A4Z0PQY0_9BACT|nr:hypothetical protein [Hymenobacter elongatus]TGE19726.1 hypothetical protein E5J99_02905 [Hymenobacter elongatus]
MLAYFPVDCIGFQETIGYFRSNPEVRPFPKMQYIKVDKLRSATIRGHYHENMRESGRADVLALRALEGPVQLFVMSGTAADNVPLLTMVPVLSLVAGAAVLGGSAIERNLWFVRRAPGPLMPVSRSAFRTQMSGFTADCPALSGPIAAGAEGYRYGDMVRIVQRYNNFITSKAQPETAK